MRYDDSNSSESVHHCLTQSPVHHSMSGLFHCVSPSRTYSGGLRFSRRPPRLTRRSWRPAPRSCPSPRQLVSPFWSIDAISMSMAESSSMILNTGSVAPAMRLLLLLMPWRRSRCTRVRRVSRFPRCPARRCRIPLHQHSPLAQVRMMRATKAFEVVKG